MVIQNYFNATYTKWMVFTFEVARHFLNLIPCNCKAEAPLEFFFVRMLWDIAPLHAYLKWLKFKLMSILHCFKKKYFVQYLSFFFFTISDSFDECLTDLQDIVSHYLGLSSFRPQHQQQHLRLSSINSPFNTRSSMFRLDSPFICFFNVWIWLEAACLWPRFSNSFPCTYVIFS